jgi:hypothetical protein
MEFLVPTQLDAIYIQKTTATQIFATTAGSLMVQGSNDNLAWTDLLPAAIPSPLNATNVTANGSISLTNSNKFTITANAAPYKYYRIFGVGTTAANILAGIASEFYFDVNALVNPASLLPKATCTEDTDGDGILNHLDLDSDGDGCSDAIEAGTAPLGTTAFSATSFFDPATTGANGFRDALETGPESGLYNGVYTYDYAIDSLLNACLDTDGDGVPDIFDLDDDNDGILDINEQINCINSGIDLNDLTFNGSAIISKSANSIISKGGDVWASSYSNQNLTLPISLSFKLPSTTGYAMFGLIPAGNTQTPANWNDNGYKFYPQTTNVYGYFGSAWSFNSSLLPTDIWSIDISTTGYVTVKKNGTTLQAYQGVVSDYKVVVSAYRASSMTEILLTDGSNPAQVTCTDIDTDNDGIPNRLDLDSDGDGCPDAIEAGTAPLGTTAVSTTSFLSPTTTGANGFADSLETVAESGIYSGTYTYNYAISNAINGCLDTDGDGIPDVFDIDDDNDGVLDVVESPCAANLPILAPTLIGTIANAPSLNTSIT